MADETVAPSATEDNETTAEQSVEVEATPAEAKTTETEAEAQTAKPDEKGPIPYERFAEINDKRKASEGRVAELERELKQATAEKPAEAPAAKVDLTEPPEHLSQRDKVDFYVQQGVERFFAEKLGMDAGQVSTLLKTIPAVSDATYEAQWQTMCKAKGLDPTDRQVQDFTRGLVKGSGYDVKDALSMVAEVLSKKKESSSATPPQRMENDATSNTMTKDKIDFVWDKNGAMDLASKGKRTSNMSTVDILKAAESMRKQAAG